MIPANHPYAVHYEHTRTDKDGNKRTYATTRPVVAWDEDGQALVNNEQGGLSVAKYQAGFQFVSESDDDRVVGIIPGGGWQFVWQYGEPNQFVEPVLCWVAYANGAVYPVSVDGDGCSEVIGKHDTEAKVFPPGAEIPPAPTADQ